jgi:alpha-D-ribose 1-methylphosphonate 5-triphosphate synthase subunit PhnI
VGYAGVRGGLAAIEAARDLVRAKRTEPGSAKLEIDQIVQRLRLAVDRVQSEGGLWAQETAARAIRQAEGDLIEAAHLVRTYRSTLPRIRNTVPVRPESMEVLRRIVPAYRTPPGPQLLGRTIDYVGRLIDFSEDASAVERSSSRPTEIPGRMIELLRQQNLLASRASETGEQFDPGRTPLRLPASRSARLAVLARGEVGAMINLWYQGVRGTKAVFHEITLGEVRHGRLAVRVKNPVTGGTISVGSAEVTEIEAIEDAGGADADKSRFDAGYGLVLGHNERKAIAMAILDISIHRDAGRSGLEQQVLQTVDGLDATGFLEHLKLPHYVTFRSMVERKQRLQRERSTNE